MPTGSRAAPGRAPIRSISPITTRIGASPSATAVRSSRNCCLDGFQAGLSWITILRKRDNFRRAFDGFEPQRIARYGDKKIAALMEDAGIVRNRAKIDGAIASARAYLELAGTQEFSKFLWDFVDGKPVQNAWRERGEVPAETEISRRLSKSLAAKGFKFCGPTIVYAFMQAVGMVNDHFVDCCRHAECAAMAAPAHKRSK